MSHKATNWAVSVRGIKPQAKLVLWHLADRHNKDTGRCDPAQETLARDCEISRSSLNNQLRVLEAAGFIKRIQRVHPDTKRRRSTAYILNFGTRKPQANSARVQEKNMDSESNRYADPCPENSQGGVQILDRNPVREPGKNLARTRVAPSEDFFLVEMIRKRKPWAPLSITSIQAQRLIFERKVSKEECRDAGVIF